MEIKKTVLISNAFLKVGFAYFKSRKRDGYYVGLRPIILSVAERHESRGAAYANKGRKQVTFSLLWGCAPLLLYCTAIITACPPDRLRRRRGECHPPAPLKGGRTFPDVWNKEKSPGTATAPGLLLWLSGYMYLEIAFI